MTRLVWGSVGERFFETGVDQGVLYLPSQPGVVWNGLISVAESPSGGQPRPYYLDGIKYLNLSTAEEFEATIVALSRPAEFAECDGWAQIHNGLFATQQQRSSFGFSYRTLVGNDEVSSDLGYKIHLVYGALAAPSARNNGSLNNSGTPSSFAWRITTLPPHITGYKRTAHLVIDSRLADPLVLAEVEDLLYGTDVSAPEMPTPDELIAIFA